MSFVLLTGGTGFIGRRVWKLLKERGYRVRILTRRYIYEQGLIDCLIVNDLADLSGCREAVKGVDVVIHLAGEKRDPARIWATNVKGTENLLVAAFEEGIKQFVHVSTVGVIGADPFQSNVISEDTVCMPRISYERSKWESEKLIRQAGINGLGVAILRPANVFGDHDPECGLLTLARSISKGLFVYLGGRDVTCNYVFVDDVAHALLTIAGNPDAVGSTYHLSDACTLGAFVDALAEDLGVKRPGVELPSSVARLVRAVCRGARRFQWVSETSPFARLASLNNQVSFATSRLVDELGFEFPVGWRAGVKRTVEYYRTQGLL